MIQDLHPVDKNGDAYKHWDDDWDDHMLVHCTTHYEGHMVVNRNEVTCPACHRDIAAYIAMKMENAK